MSVTDQLGGPAARGPLPGTGGPGGGPREMAARYALLPLRLFLGLTFLYAGIDKFTDATPFSSAMDRDTMEAMLEFARDDAAAAWLADLALDNPDLFGNGVALAEMAVGAGVLFGLLTRLAAAGGALLSLSFWLTVSWSTDPYYFGADLPFAAGFITLVLAGSGPLAFDSLLAARRSRQDQRLFG
ncbi:DoxX family protein [Streptomyces sp. 7-21]|jgi:thiosulfate dehydrogenase [quinone] large subunit|uniref:DoxX family protein n=1 Tax=Streptomyces sp. 7-21 TaxID=2802283 RepID=UPI00191F0DCE|nr:DoxX family protein [Streptomyces sp. 7-21]MBL1065684.1 DoxX family protein [Streptomyces sp. 7-21]